MRFYLAPSGCDPSASVARVAAAADPALSTTALLPTVNAQAPPAGAATTTKHGIPPPSFPHGEGERLVEYWLAILTLIFLDPTDGRWKIRDGTARPLDVERDAPTW